MSLKWKDVLYFQKSDRNAIILLVTLIVLCAVFTSLSGSLFKNKDISLAQNKTLMDFDNFQRGLGNPALQLETSEEEEPVTSSSKKQKKASANLAKLTDGQTIDLNSASIATLKRIPGVGETYAQRIIEYKNKLGGFTSIDQLKEIQGVTAKKLSSISTYITLNKKPKRLVINKATASELSQHPYVSEEQAKAVIETRQRQGKFSTMEDLLQSGVFTPRDLDRLSGYIQF